MEPIDPIAAPELNDADNGSPSASDTEATDMAAMMGFSSFGAKPNPPSKKRKLEQTAASKTGAGSGSGSNTMPLGKPRGQKKDADRGSQASGQQDMGRDEGYAQASETGEGEERVQGAKGDGGAAHGGDELMSGGNGHSGLLESGAEGRPNWNVLRRGVKDERGDMAYYDASFVEDPWKHLKIT